MLAPDDDDGFVETPNIKFLRSTLVMNVLPRGGSETIIVTAFSVAVAVTATTGQSMMFRSSRSRR